MCFEVRSKMSMASPSLKTFASCAGGVDNRQTALSFGSTFPQPYNVLVHRNLGQTSSNCDKTK